MPTRTTRTPCDCCCAHPGYGCPGPPKFGDLRATFQVADGVSYGWLENLFDAQHASGGSDGKRNYTWPLKCYKGLPDVPQVYACDPAFDVAAATVPDMWQARLDKFEAMLFDWTFDFGSGSGEDHYFGRWTQSLQMYLEWLPADPLNADPALRMARARLAFRSAYQSGYESSFRTLGGIPVGDECARWSMTSTIFADPDVEEQDPEANEYACDPLYLKFTFDDTTRDVDGSPFPPPPMWDLIFGVPGLSDIYKFWLFGGASILLPVDEPNGTHPLTVIVTR